LAVFVSHVTLADFEQHSARFSTMVFGCMHLDGWRLASGIGLALDGVARIQNRAFVEG
jgi:hypothetical protein